ncbi:MAG TPA: portal protein, partial [Nitrospira sp.]|nr:portal protein [Nitrospira sp.]
MAVSITSPNAVITGDPLIDEARERLDWVIEWEGTWRPRFLDDIRFADGDSDNNAQWPDAIQQSREIDKRPCLTINIVRQHNLQIMNQAKKNKSTAKIMGTGNGATQESANVFKWIIERIQYQSNAQEAYSVGRKFQVKGGIGWWRIATDYYDENSFDQDIFIRPIPDPLSVYMDPDCKQFDCSDARYAFVFSTMTKEEFLEEFPGKETLATMQPLGVAVADMDVRGENHVRVCEYFRKIFEKDELISFMDSGDGQRKTLLRSKMTPNMARELKKDELTKVREISRPIIEWYLIAGEEVIDETVWVGKYIPLIRVIGEEEVVDGVLDRKGHTRAMKSAQRMYNFNASSQVEFVALQGKTPWVAPVKAIEEVETYWNTANTQNHSVLPWNHVDDENPDRPIPPPFRQEPPQLSPAYQMGMDTAFNQLMMASGQWQNQMGMLGNERTGEAIARRQEQSDTSVYHFEDNYG